MSDDEQTSPTSMAGSIVVLLNPFAGEGGHQAAEILALFLAVQADVEIVVLEPHQDPTDAARAAAARASIVVAAGGDGTVSRVVAGLVGTPAILGVLPLGTLNHFAKDLRIPLDLKGAVATIVARQVGSVDLGWVNDRVFLNGSSIGVYPNIVELREELRRRGHRKWPAMALATFRVLRHYRGVFVRIEAGDRRQSSWRTPFVFVGNNEYTIDGVRIGARVRLDAGRLFAYLAPRVRTRELPMLLVRALLGRARQSGAFEILSTQEVWIETPHSRRIRVAFDGEVMTMTTPLHYQARPGALKVVQPPGVS